VRIGNKALVVSLIAILAYANSVANRFVWDDYDLLVQNRFLHSLHGLPHLFTFTYWRDEHLAHGTAYRPLVQMSFAVEYSLWGRRPAGYHLSNVVGHAAASVGVLWLLSTPPFSAPTAAFLGALLFAVHPVHAEAVNWLKNRSEVWSLVWLILAWTCFRGAVAEDQRRRGGLRLGAAFFFCAAMLTKEAAVFMPALVTAYVLAYARRDRRAWRLCVGAWVLAVAFVFCLFIVGRGRGHPGVPQWQPRGAERLAGPPATLWEYVRLFAVPNNLCVDRGAPWPNGPWWPAGLGALTALLGIVVCLRCRGRAGRLMAAGSAVFLIALLPQCNILPIRVRPIAEQRLYVPSVGLCAVFASLLATGLPRGLRGRRVIALIVCVCMTAMTVAGNFSWRDMRAMARASVRAAPSVSRMRHNLAYGYDQLGLWKLAEREYDHTLALKRDPVTLRAAGVLASKLGRTRRAATLLEESCRRRPSALNFRLLAKVYLDEKRVDEALRCLETALTQKEEPDERALTLSRKGDALRLAGRLKEAQEAYESAESLSPTQPYASYGLGRVYERRGELRKAAVAYARALRAEPSFEPAARALRLLRMRPQYRN